MVISGARLLIAYIAIAFRGRYAIGIFSQSISLVIPTQYVLTKAQEANGDRCVIAGLGEAVRLGAMLTRSCSRVIQCVPGAEYKRFMNLEQILRNSHRFLDEI